MFWFSKFHILKMWIKDGGLYYYPHIMEEETVAQKGYITSSRLEQVGKTSK